MAGLVVGALAVAPATANAQAAKPKPKPAASAAAGGTGGSATAGEKPLDKKQLAEAKKHYTEGETKYKAGDYAGALTDFQGADAIKETPQADRYIGLCHDNLGRFPEAVAAYQKFLANVPAKMAAQGDEVRARVSAIQQLPGKLHVTSDPLAAAFSVDGKAEANPTPADVEVAPGHHTLHFSAAGHDPVDKDIDVAFASKQDITVTLPASAPPPPPPPVAAAPPPAATPPAETTAPAAPPSKLPAWITGGLAVAAAGVGTAFGVMALNDKSDFNNTPTTGKADDGENHALISDMAFGVAITLGVTSAVLFLTSDDTTPAPAATPVPASGSAKGARAVAVTKPRHDVSITPTPFVSAHGGGAGALIRF
jgi:hypothetical protein